MFKNITKMKTPHTYAIIFGVVIFAWILTFLIPAGRFSTHDITYTDNNGTEKTRTVLQQDSFRYYYHYNMGAVQKDLTAIANNPEKLDEMGIDKGDLDDLLKTNSAEWTDEDLSMRGLPMQLCTKNLVWASMTSLHRCTRLPESGVQKIPADLVF